MEKKKIMARKPSSAEEQEQALKLLMKTETLSTPSVTDNRVQQNTPLSELPNIVSSSKKASQKTAQQPTSKKQNIMQSELTQVQRITVDLPIDLYETLKQSVDENGTTIKWLIVKLLRENLK